MRFEGQLKRHGGFWLAEVSAFDAMTQGRTRGEALRMVTDLLQTLANDPEFDVLVHPTSARTFEISSPHVATLIALLLRRQREKSGLSLAEVAARLGQRSRTAYARYEQGRCVPTIDRLEALLLAVAPDQKIVWRLAS